MANAWLFYALTAALLWGFGYAVSERVMSHGITPAFFLLISAVIMLPLYLLVAQGTDSLKEGFEIMLSNKTVFFMTLAVALTTVLANYLVLVSINEKNATLASLVEIAYPIFTFIFAWLLFRDVQLTWTTALAGMLIFSGIALIYFKS